VATDAWNNYRLKTLVVGGPELRALTEFSGKQVVDVTGRLSLQELLALIEHAKIVITTDSGLFHISGALGRPTVRLFRAQRPEHATRYPSTAVILGKHAECRSRCQWDKCRHIPCDQLADIGASVVLRSLDSMVPLR